MTELERRSSSDLLNRGEGKQGLRQRRDKEQMVAEHGAVTQSLQVSVTREYLRPACLFHFQAISRQLAETVERSKQTVEKMEGSSTIVDEVPAGPCPSIFAFFCSFFTLKSKCIEVSYVEFKFHF